MSAQTAATHVIENFGSGDLLDLGTLEYDRRRGSDVSLREERSNIGDNDAVGSEVAWLCMITVPISMCTSILTHDGADDMVLTLDSVSSISASQVDL